MRATPLSVLARWCGGRLTGGDPSVRGICPDTRRLGPGEVFLALRGRNRDGHEWVAAAAAAGAAGAIVAAGFVPPAGLPAILVADPAEALIEIARGYRRTLPVLALAVTGSNGKTTTKGMIGVLLSGEGPVAVSPESFNNRLGVPLSVLGVEEGDWAAVFELGMNHPGEIGELAGICLPEIGLITNVGPAHLGFLGSLSAVARAKGELLEKLSGERIAVLNRDDSRLRALGREFSGRTIYFGFSRGSDVRIISAAAEPAGQRVRLAILGKEEEVFLPVPGRHNALNLAAAAAAAQAAGLSPDTILSRVSGLKLPGMRFTRREAARAVVIDDAYNANPASMRAALAAWLEIPARGRRILVSGDMMELGKYSRRAHRAWGRRVAAAGCDLLVFVGEASRDAAAAAREAGQPEGGCRHFPSAPEAGCYLRDYVRPDDLLLLKGSRLVGLEKALAFLTAAGG